MYLFIDPSHHDSIRLVVLYSTHEKEYQVVGKNRELLIHIMSTLDQEQLSLSDVEGVAIRMGVGGFSSTRIASVVGNSLSFALHIPVVGVNLDHPSFGALTTLFSSAKLGVYLSPTYSSEPTIGTNTS